MVQAQWFLLLLFISRFGGSGSEDSLSTTWIAVTPSRPVVEAFIETAQWRMSTETSSNETILSVLERSTLILICRAAYPVFWQHNNQSEGMPVQSRTCNPFLGNDTKFCSSASNFSASSTMFGIPAVEQYQSNMTFKNFSSNDTGIFVCQSDVISGLQPFQITVQLETHPEPKPAKFAQILQAGFDQVQAQAQAIMSPQPHFGVPSLRVPIVYTEPIGADTELLLNQGRDGKSCFDLTYTSNSTPADLNIETTTLAPNVKQASINVSRSVLLCEGRYQFVIQSRLKNNTVINATSQFWLRVDTNFPPTESHQMEADTLSPLNASIELNILWFYELRMYLSSPFALTEADLQVEERKLQGADCKSTPVPSEKLVDVCGIRGASLFDKGVRIFLQVTRSSCTLTVLMNKFSNSRQFLKGANSGPVPLKSSLFTTGFNGDIFGYTFDLQGAKVISEPRVWENGATVYANDTYRLRCLIPLCHFLRISWQKVDLKSWALDGLTSYPPLGSAILADTPNFIPGTQINVSTYDYDINNTMEYDLAFSSLDHSHTGKYICVIMRAPDRQQMIRPPMAIFGINVIDPIAPYFPNGSRFGENNILLQDGKAELSCAPEGDPKPTISWTWEPDSRDGFVEPKLSADNQTAVAFRPGTYKCAAMSKYGEDGKIFSVSKVSYSPIIIAVLTVIVAVAAIAVAVWYLRRRAADASFKELAKTLQNSSESVPLDDSTFLNDQVQFIQYNRTLEIDRSRFTMGTKLLGMGEFGVIYKGELKLNDFNEVQEVAIKLPRDSANLQQFRALADELKIMSHIRPHINVLPLVGACTQNLDKRQLFMLTEFCENGSLRDYLIKNFMKFEGFEVNSAGQFLGAPGAVEALLKYAYQAANGMAYLAAEKILHRDLALRNLLLTANHIVKIADFGMSRQNMTSAVYRKRLSSDVPVPIFWMAVESLANGQYTKTSDVWSFGIALWEMFSCGKMPYPNHEPNAAFRSWLMEKEENRMGPPKIACDEIYQLMRSCWKENPDTRPSFSECKRMISRILEQRAPSMYQSMIVALSDAWLAATPNIGPRISDDSGISTPDNAVTAYIASDTGQSMGDFPKNGPSENGLPVGKKVEKADEHKRMEEIELQKRNDPLVSYVNDPGSYTISGVENIAYDPGSYTTFSTPDIPYSFAKS